jgi:hypothetical protein
MKSHNNGAKYSLALQPNVKNSNTLRLELDEFLFNQYYKLIEIEGFYKIIANFAPLESFPNEEKYCNRIEGICNRFKCFTECFYSLGYIKTKTIQDLTNIKLFCYLYLNNESDITLLVLNEDQNIIEVFIGENMMPYLSLVTSELIDGDYDFNLEKLRNTVTYKLKVA